MINRETASQLLGVSVRTIDRYIRRGKLKARQTNGRIWLNREDILRFPRATISERQKKTTDPFFYRDLFEESRRALADYQQKLENATYRIGQLESQLLQSGSFQPMPKREDSATVELLRRDLQDRLREIDILKETVKREKGSRIIFAILTYILLILLPVIWFLSRA